MVDGILLDTFFELSFTAAPFFLTASKGGDMALLPEAIFLPGLLVASDSLSSAPLPAVVPIIGKCVRMLDEALSLAPNTILLRWLLDTVIVPVALEALG